jgi:cytochrome c oxidase assembly factor CtaG
MRRFRAALRLIAVAAVLSLPAYAHGKQAEGPRNWDELLLAWEWDPGVVIPLFLSGLFYLVGVDRTWKRAGRGHGVTRIDALCFAGGWFALFLALVSPLHTWGSMLFSAHMTQHEVLMLVAAPLLVLSSPLAPFLRALPIVLTRRLVRWSKTPGWLRVWRVLTNAFVAWLIHAAVLWTWHIPTLFDATLDSDLVHAVQHLSFLLSALLFWWAVMHARSRVMGYGVAVLYMFTTALHSGLLGALITFAATAWYPAYAGRTSAWGLTPLEDQQLGGLIMWVPACTVYIFAGLALFAAWLRGSEQRVLRWEAQFDSLPAAHKTETTSQT